MNSIVTHLIAFVVGAASGAAGNYLADRLTDRRRQNESGRKAKNLLSKVESQMPDLIAEMRSDLRSHPLSREFFPYNAETICSPDPGTLFYDPDIHPNLAEKISILEAHDLVTDVTTGNAKRYRITEAFAELLSEK